MEYSSFFSKGVNGQSGSELVVSQGFDFPTVYNSRNRAGRDKKEAVDYRAEALRRNVLLEAKTLCLDMIRAEPAKRPAGQTHAKCRRAVGLV